MIGPANKQLKGQGQIQFGLLGGCVWSVVLANSEDNSSINNKLTS